MQIRVSTPFVLICMSSTGKKKCFVRHCTNMQIIYKLGFKPNLHKGIQIVYLFAKGRERISPY